MTAFVIDICLIGMLISLIGIASFRLTDGRIRLSSGLLDFSTCSKADPKQIGLPIPPHFNVTETEDCTANFLGFEHDRTVTITEVTESDTVIQKNSFSGSVYYKRSFSYPLDPSGHLTEPFYLDRLWLILLPAYILLAEWLFARTLGKRLMGLRIRSLNGGPIDFIQALKRLIIRFLPWPFWILAYIPAVGKSTTLLLSVDALLVIAAAAVIVNLFLATRRRVLPWDDAWAATEVVRD